MDLYCIEHDSEYDLNINIELQNLISYEIVDPFGKVHKLPKLELRIAAHEAKIFRLRAITLNEVAQYELKVKKITFTLAEQNTKLNFSK